MNVYKHRTAVDRARLSAMSLETVDSSVLDTLMGSPILREEASVHVATNTPQIRVDPPNQQDNFKFQSASTTEVRAMKVSNGKEPSHAISNASGEREDEMQGKLALPLVNVNNGRHSMFVTSSIGMGGALCHHQRSQSPPWTSFPARPASVAGASTLEPGQTKSWVTDGHRKGHKRQNCIRISSASFPKPPGQDKEVFLLDHPGRFGKSPPPAVHGVLSNQYAFPAQKKVSSPFDNPPKLQPTYGSPKQQRTATRITRSEWAFADPFTGSARSRPWPLSPINSTDAKCNSFSPGNRQGEASPDLDSPILPSPALTSASLFARQKRVQGPRQIHVSTQFGNLTSPSPAGRRSLRKPPEYDLRRSVMTQMRRNMSEDQLSTSDNVFRYSTSPSATQFMTTTGVPSASRVGSGNRFGFGKTTTTKVPVSPSNVSVGAGSVWEDVSVRADSPEPQMWYHEAVSEDQENERMGSPKMSRSYTTPQSKGLGLGLGNGTTATPGSLYDHDGFLKEPQL